MLGVSPAVCKGLAYPPLIKLATVTSRNNCKLSDSRSSRPGDSSMKLSGQSRKDPRRQMRTKRTPYSSSFIGSHQITHVDPVKGRTTRSNLIKNSLNVGTFIIIKVHWADRTKGCKYLKFLCTPKQQPCILDSI